MSAKLVDSSEPVFVGVVRSPVETSLAAAFCSVLDFFMTVSVR